MESPSKQLVYMEAWARKHNSHGFYIDGVFWCPKGEGPDKKPGDWTRPETAIRIPDLDLEITADETKGNW